MGILTQDSSGNWWNLGVDATGHPTTTAATGPSPAQQVNLATLTGTSVLNWCSLHSELLPLQGVAGYSLEPGLSIISDAMGEIINDVNDWKWNRVELSPVVAPLVTATNKQNYLFAGASAFVLAANPSTGQAAVPSSGAGIGLLSNNAITVTAGVVTVATLEPHRFAVGNTVYLTNVFMNVGTATKYNATYSDNGSITVWGNGFVITAVTATSFSFAAIAGQNNGDQGGAPGFGTSNLASFGWLSGASMIELNNNSSPPNYRHLKARRTLPRWSKCADPELVSIEKNNGDGSLWVRFAYTPSSDIWAVGLVYQMAKPVIFSISAQGTFSPIPDSLDYLIRQAVLYRCYRYLQPDSTKTTTEYNKLQADIKKSLGYDQAEESNVYLEPEESLSDLPGPYFIGF